MYHLAAGRGEKSYPDAFMNSVVTTRNLLDATLEHRCLKRIVSISSFSVYSNQNKPHGRLLDESCPMESRPELRGAVRQVSRVLGTERRRIRAAPGRIQRLQEIRGHRAQAAVAFAFSAIFWNAATSRTARSASSFRFTSMFAFLRPAISVL